MFPRLVHPPPFDSRIHIYQVTDLLKPDCTWIWGRPIRCAKVRISQNRTYSSFLMRRRSPAALSSAPPKCDGVLLCFAPVDGSYPPFLYMFPCALCLDFTSHPCARPSYPLRVSIFFSGSSSWVSPGFFPSLLRILCHP